MTLVRSRFRSPVRSVSAWLEHAERKRDRSRDREAELSRSLSEGFGFPYSPVSFLSTPSLALRFPRRVLCGAEGFERNLHILAHETSSTEYLRGRTQGIKREKEIF